jgi:hypothetical protein
MSILNYFFIGFAFTFVIDLLIDMESIKNHPAVVDKNWGIKERILCIAIWPIAALTFIIAFTKQFFR